MPTSIKAAHAVGMTGLVECHDRVIINSVGIVNDVGGSSELPVGSYRVQVMRAWHDYEIGGRAEGVLLDSADIETSRIAGSTEWTPEHYEREYPNNPGLAERCRAAKASYQPERVFFALTDFTPDR